MIKKLSSLRFEYGFLRMPEHGNGRIESLRKAIIMSRGGRVLLYSQKRRTKK